MLGLEARGTSGAAMMFETAVQNGWVIREMAKAGCQPRATSIMFDFYKRLPFASDFNQYKKRLPEDDHRGAGLNVAFVDDFAHYHTWLDNTENCNLASLQHMGEYCLKLARHFGAIEMGDCRAPDATYFNTIGGHMIVYPLSWGGPLTLAAVLLVVLVFALGFARGPPDGSWHIGGLGSSARRGHRLGRHRSRT